MSKPTPIPAIRERVFAVTEHDDNCVRCVLIGHQKADQDSKLRELVFGLSILAGDIDGTMGRKQLIGLFGFTFGWLLQLGVEMPYNQIHQERVRQEELFRQKKHLFSVASPVVSPARKLRVLVEGIGEVAKSIRRIEMFAEARNNYFKHDAECTLVDKLVQVAAVLCAWLEALEAADKSAIENRKLQISKPTTKGTK